MTRKINDEGRALIKECEGFRETAYLDTGKVWTIGWGTTEIDGKPVRQGQKITREKAEECFLKDIQETEKYVEALVKCPLNDNQFSALVSFCYNIGLGQFAASTMLKKLNASDYVSAAGQFNRWIYDNGVQIKGLMMRRIKEFMLFNKSIG